MILDTYCLREVTVRVRPLMTVLSRKHILMENQRQTITKTIFKHDRMSARSTCRTGSENDESASIRSHFRFAAVIISVIFFNNRFTPASAKRSGSRR